jgi:hypothetical protein
MEILPVLDKQSSYSAKTFLVFVIKVRELAFTISETGEREAKES